MSGNTCTHLSVVAVIWILSTSVGRAEHIEAFTEPYRKIAVPASEIGVIESLLVKEGDTVSEKQLLGKLDDSVLRSSLTVAASAMKASGAMLSAEAELTTRKQHFEGYQTLQVDGNATSRELARAELEMQQAAARLQSVREELELRQLEFERVKMQIRQRQIISPINGIVVAIDKQAGEFVSPTDPVVLHIVQLDVLKAVFSVPRSAAIAMKPSQKAELNVGYDGEICEGVIEYVSPITNPESNTVQVKVRIENTAGNHPSGVTCRWNLETSKTDQGVPVTKTNQESFQRSTRR